MSLRAGGFKRQPSKRIRIRRIFEGHMDASEAPPVLKLNSGEKCHRIRLLGLVLSKTQKNSFPPMSDVRETGEDGEYDNPFIKAYTSIELDDGSAVISVRAWDEGAKTLDKFSVGDLVEVIGRPRIYQGKIYLLFECGSLISDVHWILLHELNILKDELSLEGGKTSEVEGAASNISEPCNIDPVRENLDVVETGGGEQEAEDLADTVLSIISKLDGGAGVPLKVIEEKTGVSRIEDIMETLITLLNDGLIYEPKPQIFKKL